MTNKNQPRKLRAAPSGKVGPKPKEVSGSGQFLKPSVEEDQGSVPVIDLSDCAWISSEMEAQRAALLYIEGIGSDVRLTNLARRALLTRPKESTSTEEYLVRTALALISEVEPESVPDNYTPQNRDGNPATNFFEVVALGWIRWVSTGDISVFMEIPELREETGSATKDPALTAELVSLHLWSKGLDALVRHRENDAQEYLEKAILIGEQFGSQYCPAIKWTMVASFTLKQRIKKSSTSSNSLRH
jgi:hypothetical protein